VEVGRIVEKEVFIENQELKQNDKSDLFVYLNDSANSVSVHSFDPATTTEFLLKVPNNTEIFEQMSTDSEIIFVTRTRLDFDFGNGSGYGADLLAVNFYSNDEKKVERLFTSNDTDWTYITIDEEFATDNRIWTFYVYGCWQCGGHRPQRYLYDTDNYRNSKTVQQAVEFEWLSETEYRYKPFIYNDDPYLVCEVTCSYTSTDHLEWLYDSLE
jgi:hypothetical protein